MINRYDIGDEIVFITTFINRLGNLTNPAVVEAAVKEPDGTVTVVDMNPTAVVGVWEGLYHPTKSGKSWFRVESSGGVDSAEEKPFIVNEEKVVIP